MLEWFGCLFIWTSSSPLYYHHRPITRNSTNKSLHYTKLILSSLNLDDCTRTFAQESVFIGLLNSLMTAQGSLHLSSFLPNLDRPHKDLCSPLNLDDCTRTFAVLSNLDRPHKDLCTIIDIPSTSIFVPGSFSSRPWAATLYYFKLRFPPSSHFILF